MRKPLSSKRRHAEQLRSCRIASTVLCASLLAFVVWIGPTGAVAQAISSTVQPPSGMGITSPLATRSSPPAGIPLGSTEIAAPGISPASPSQSTGMATCAIPDDAGSPGAPFDGGGISGSPSLSCADSQPLQSPLPQPSLNGRAGIALGATELSGAGISPAPPATSPDLSNSANPTTTPGNP